MEKSIDEKEKDVCPTCGAKLENQHVAGFGSLSQKVCPNGCDKKRSTTGWGA